MLSTATTNHHTSANHQLQPQKPKGRTATAAASAETDDALKTYQNLFVACLPRSLTDVDLLRLFAQYNPTHAAVMMDVSTGRSKGYGFVSFASVDEGRVAATALSGKSVKLGHCTFTMHISPSKHNGTTVLNESNFVYLRNVPAELGVDDVRDLLARLGALVWLQTRNDDDHPGLLLVMAEYATVDDAARSIRELHRSIPFPNLSKVPIMAKFADPGAVVLQRRARMPAFCVEPLCEAALNAFCGPAAFSTTRGASTASVHSEGSDASMVYRNDPYSTCGYFVLSPRLTATPIAA